MTDRIRERGPRPENAADAAADAAGRLASASADKRISDDGGAPDEAKPRSRRRRRRRRSSSRAGAKGAAAAPSLGEGGAPEAKRARDGAAAPKATQERSDARRGPEAGAAKRRRGARRRRGPVYAALDLGTNNCRLLVARAEGRGFQIVDAFSRVVRLGEGLSETGRLSEAAIDRSVAALSICAERVAKHHAANLRAIATEACRRAANQAAFLERVKSETGIALDVIAPEEEARLAVAGCAPLLDVKADELLVFDIGGGSTELMWVDLSSASPPKRRDLLMALAHGGGRSERARAAARHVRDWISVPVGVVTLGELFDRVIDDGEKFAAMNDHVNALLAPFQQRIGEASRERLAKLQILGTSGTITTLAGVHLELERYSRREVDGLWIASAAVERVIDRLLSLNAYERRHIPCVGEDRATNLMAGAAILRSIVRAWPAQRLRVADRGLREGMLYGLIQEGRDRKARQGGGATPKPKGGAEADAPRPAEDAARPETEHG